jgi:hypothetical protein
MRRLAIAVLTLSLAAGALFAASPASAATKDPCKVVTTAEISKAFGGATVSKGAPGLKTAVHAQCKYEVAATGDLPEGHLIVIVMFIRGKAAYDGLKKLSDQYVPTTGLSKSIYNEKQSVVNTLKGDVLLGMQGLFSGDTLPITNDDVEAQLVAISKVGLKRV